MNEKAWWLSNCIELLFYHHLNAFKPYFSHKLMIIFAEKKGISQKKCIFAAESYRQIIKGYKVVRLEG